QCYLQEKYFSPSNKVLKQLRLKPEEKYVIIRLVSWNASHDIGHSGISRTVLEELINEIKKYSKIFISSESELPQELEKYKLQINPIEIHDILYFSNLFIGEGATMASECAMLGTPSIYVNSLTAGTLEAQERDGLLHIFQSNKEMIDKAVDILKNNDSKNEQRERCNEILKSKIDVNLFIEQFVLDYAKNSNPKRELN
ncbi:MAG: DUF354 domain-containing protein, partial [Candidatus Neomarinimicrobiota bacterium]